MQDPFLDIDINCKGTINTLESVRKERPDARVVYLGTSTQCGRMTNALMDEAHPEFPLDIYSANKSVSEKYVLIYANAYRLRATVVRLSNVFGPRASIHSPEFTFNNYFIGLALQGKDITVFGDGSQKRNTLYVEDVVSALIRASRAEGIMGETFFAVGDDHYSVAHIAEETVKCMGSGRARFVEWPKDRKDTDVGDAVISNKKIRKALGWSPRFDLKSGLTSTRAYYETCLQEYLR